MALTIVDTHNMIAFLTKSDASKGFDQIIDFLNASSIKYALTVNPNIYVSVIKQFWSTVTVKKVGKGFFGVDTPLFEGMLVAQQADEGAAEVNVDDVPAAGVADEGAASVNVNDIPTAVDEPSIPSPTPLLEIQKSI
nr:hypothetical protein [Tanacetum cinerariifolium]